VVHDSHSVETLNAPPLTLSNIALFLTGIRREREKRNIRIDNLFILFSNGERRRERNSRQKN
jgi:hypothetical protein